MNFYKSKYNDIKDEKKKVLESLVTHEFGEEAKNFSI